MNTQAIGFASLVIMTATVGSASAEMTRREAIREIRTLTRSDGRLAARYKGERRLAIVKGLTLSAAGGLAIGSTTALALVPWAPKKVALAGSAIAGTTTALAVLPSNLRSTFNDARTRTVIKAAQLGKVSELQTLDWAVAGAIQHPSLWRSYFGEQAPWYSQR